MFIDVFLKFYLDLPVSLLRAFYFASYNHRHNKDRVGDQGESSNGAELRVEVT